MNQMSKFKRIASKGDNIVVVEHPLSDEDIEKRHADYPLMAPSQFAKTHRYLFKPISFTWNGKEHQIQINSCTSPFCKWFSLQQLEFDKVKGKPSRYRLTGEPKENKQRLRCNPDPLRSPSSYTTLNCTSGTLSNWSAAEEIKRSATNNSVVEIKPTYSFHREDCVTADLTPFESKVGFYKRGTSSTNSQKWQCKSCKKITNVMPSLRQSFNYHQKRNDVLVTFSKLIMARMPIKRVCKVLEIGSGTYYAKLEWLYRRCLEFLERHETQPLAKAAFNELWVNTDKLIYYLNNVRMKGMGGKRFTNLEDKQMQTHIVVSADVRSRYVFGADVAYDWDVRMTDLEQDTLLYRDDHLDEFSRKNARLRFSHTPQSPTELDTQSDAEYKRERTNSTAASSMWKDCT
jgi:transposase-like protein